MTNSEKISYKAVCDFFDGKNDITDHFNKLSFDNPAFGIFNEIEKLSLDLPVLKKFPKFTFKTIEQYLEDYFCSNISPAQAQHIKSAILVDESALQIFLYKIEQYKATPDTIIKSDNMQTMSNKGLFKIIKKNRKYFSEARKGK